jgi:hypothetical protein
MLKLSTTLATALAAVLKSELDGGTLKIFSGPVPATAGAAVDGASVLLAEITVDGDGSTGLTFTTPTTGTLNKSASEDWICLGTNVTSGTATFYRFTEAGDAGTALSTTHSRIQGIVGTDPFTCDLDSFSYNVPVEA